MDEFQAKSVLASLEISSKSIESLIAQLRAARLTAINHHKLEITMLIGSAEKLYESTLSLMISIEKDMGRK